MKASHSTPVPTALKIVRGNPGRKVSGLGAAQGPANEPRPGPFSEKVPTTLEKDPDAKGHWKNLVPILLRMRVLTEADTNALVGLCVALSTLGKMRKELTKLGLMMQTRTGGIAMNPLLGAVQQQTKLVNEMLREFGMTPAARTRVRIADSNPMNDDWERRDQQRGSTSPVHRPIPKLPTASGDGD